MRFPVSFFSPIVVTNGLLYAIVTLPLPYFHQVEGQGKWRQFSVLLGQAWHNDPGVQVGTNIHGSELEAINQPATLKVKMMWERIPAQDVLLDGGSLEKTKNFNYLDSMFVITSQRSETGLILPALKSLACNIAFSRRVKYRRVKSVESFRQRFVRFCSTVVGLWQWQHPPQIWTWGVEIVFQKWICGAACVHLYTAAAHTGLVRLQGFGKVLQMRFMY